MILEFFSIPVSALSLAISATTLWLTYLRRGRLRMTRPTVVFFGYDLEPHPTPKIFLRTLLYSSAAQGQIVEGMYIKRRHAGSERAFSFWGYGETEKLTPGSGLCVPRSGVAANHHFVLSVHKEDEGFAAGAQELTVFARVVGDARPLKLATFTVVLDDAHINAPAKHDGVLFEAEPDSQQYIGHLRGR